MMFRDCKIESEDWQSLNSNCDSEVAAREWQWNNRSTDRIARRCKITQIQNGLNTVRSMQNLSGCMRNITCIATRVSKQFVPHCNDIVYGALSKHIFFGLIYCTRGPHCQRVRPFVKAHWSMVSIISVSKATMHCYGRMLSSLNRKKTSRASINHWVSWTPNQERVIAQESMSDADCSVFHPTSVKRLSVDLSIDLYMHCRNTYVKWWVQCAHT